MEISDTDKLGTRLYAMELRLAELDQERHHTQLRVQQLESCLEDARLAHLLGEESAAAEIGGELERSRGTLEKQEQAIDRVKQIRRQARGEYAMRRWKERREQQLREAGG